MARNQPSKVGQTMTVMEPLLAELVHVVDQALQPEHANICFWLQSTPTDRRPTESG